MTSFHLYILRCSDGSYYTGHTDNLESRLAAHQQGLIEGYTFTRRPVQLVYSSEFTRRADALAMERRIKRWSRRKKEALIQGDWLRLQQLSRGPSTSSG